ncbi:Spo0E family sporulation regulatory protein-aspartic acid phosphatase [Domibacillus sp. DTU_2020_1001157_1_SI_ALB_TIR_016]
MRVLCKTYNRNIHIESKEVLAYSQELDKLFIQFQLQNS